MDEPATPLVAPPVVASPASDAAVRSLVDDLRQLVGDGRTLLEAELAYHKSRASVAGGAAKRIALWGGLALVLVFFALLALIVGLLLALTPLLGGWGAMAAVTLGIVLAAALCGLAAKRNWSAAQAVLTEPEPEQ